MQHLQETNSADVIAKYRDTFCKQCITPCERRSRHDNAGNKKDECGQRKQWSHDQAKLNRQNERTLLASTELTVDRLTVKAWADKSWLARRKNPDNSRRWTVCDLELWTSGILNVINVTWTFWRLIISNQIKFISSKQKYKITRTKTIQLVSYGLRKVLKRHGYLRQKRKQIVKKLWSVSYSTFIHEI